MKLALILTKLAAFLLLCSTFSEVRAQSYGLTSRPTVGAYLDSVVPPLPPAEPTTWSTAVAFPSLSFQNPMGLGPMPGTNKLFVWQREGQVYLIDPTTQTKTVCLDLSNQCQGWDDCGMFAVVPHPNFASNHYIFVFYVYVTPGMVQGSPTQRVVGQPTLPQGSDPRSRLSRFTLDANGVAIPGSEFVLINQKIYNTWHKGGGMLFHPTNGLLYLTMGNDYRYTQNDQKINNDLAGGVIRIDVDKVGGSFSHAPPRQPTNGTTFTNGVPNYFIPNSNPFVGQSGVLEEFYSLGLRSPHRMTIDPPSGKIYIGDVGEGSWEEVNVIAPGDPAGLNFQWGFREGFVGTTPASVIGVSRDPLIAFPHGGGQTNPQMSAIIGGYVYRGSALATQIGGRYICGDNVSAKVYWIDETTNPPTANYIVTLPKSTGPNSGTDYTSLSSFGLDANNELYMTTLGATDGNIYKLLATGGGAGGSTPLPATLSATGVFSNLATLTPSAKLIPYTINAPFWSDGATKSRWAVIPNTANIGFNATGEWTFPTGSVFVKHFELPVDDTNSAVHKRLETRLLVKMATGGVYGATYKWRDDNSDADLLTSAGLSENVAIYTPNSLGAPGGLTSTDIGNPGAGSTSGTGDDLTIVAGGSDVWGTADHFRFCYLTRAGDFDLRLRVNNLTGGGSIAKVGLMARGSVATNNGQYAYSIAYPTNSGRAYDFEYRVTDGAGAAATQVIGTPNVLPRWVRLRREGNVFISLTSLDGTAWTEMGRVTIAMPTTVYFGVAACAVSGTAKTTATVHLERDTRLQTWYYPSRSDCTTCHNSHAGDVLGIKTRQLNCNELFPGTGVTDNQIRAWNHVGIFDPANPPQEGAIPSMDKLAAVTDATATLEKRARSFFDANCSQCHRPGGVPAQWDARYDTPLLQQGIINGLVGDVLGVPGSHVVTPQDLTHSIIYSRVNRVGQNQMPPIARNTIDTNAVAMLSAWINSLPAITLAGATDGTAYLNSDTLTLTANALAGSGSLNRVEFWDNGVLIGQDTGLPYSLTLQKPLPVGYHQITAIVYDSQGGVSPSILTTLNVLPLQLSLLGFDNLGAPMLETQIPNGRGYFIEYTDDLTAGWNTLQNGTADGQTLDLQDPAATGNHRYYRLRVLP